MSETDEIGRTAIVLYTPSANGLADLVGRGRHDPCCRVTVGSTQLSPVAASVDMGFDSISASAQVQLKEGDLSGDHWNERLKVEVGYLDDDGTENYGVWPNDGTIFDGFVEDDDAAFFPWGRGIKGAGQMRRTQYPFAGESKNGDRVDYKPGIITDTELVKALLTMVGVPAGSQDINGDGVKLGKVNPVELKIGGSPADMISQLDQAFGYRTYDSRDDVIHRRLITYQPEGVAHYSYEQGVNVLSVSRPRNVKKVKNQVKVTGAEVGGVPFGVTWQATTALVPAEMGFITETISYDHIEGFEEARIAAARRMPQVCRISEDVSLEVPGNPLLVPGKTVALTAPKVGIDTATNFFLRHINHSFGSDGFYSRLTLEGGAGEAGARVNMKPQAIIAPAVIANEGGLTFKVACSGASSYDPDWYAYALSYAWSDNLVGAVTRPNGNNRGQYILDGVTPAMLEQGFTVTLSVTDPDMWTSDAESFLVDVSTMGVVLPGVQETPTADRKVYVAAGSRAEASPDSGKSWRVWSPTTGAVISTPPYPPLAYSLFGTSDGKLYWTGDMLASEPELVGTFPDAVLCVWINQATTARVTVGCRDGKVYRCADIDASPQVWTSSPALGSPVVFVWEQMGGTDLRACVGAMALDSSDGFASYAMRASWSTGRPRTMAFSGFGNYIAGDGLPVICDDAAGVFTLPTLTPAAGDVRAIAVDWAKDRVLAVDTGGRVMERLASAPTTFAGAAQVGSAVGLTGNMLAEPGHGDCFWLATDSYLLFSADGGRGWTAKRNYQGITGTGAIQMGLGNSSWTGIPATVIASVATGGSAYQLGQSEAEPGDWHENSSSVQWAPTGAETAEALAAIGANFIAVPGAAWMCATPGDVGDGALTLFRYDAAVPAGEIASVTLKLQIDDHLEGLWVGGKWITSGESPRSTSAPHAYYVFSVPKEAINRQGNTTIAFKVRNEGLGPTAAQFSLEVV